MLKIYSEKSEFMRVCSAPCINSEQQVLPVGKGKDKINCIRIKKVSASNDIFLKALILLNNFPCSLGQPVSDVLCGNSSLAPGPASCLLSPHASDLMHRNAGLHLGWLSAPAALGVSETRLNTGRCWP